MPLELALEVNGYDELCSMTGYEDSQFGMRLAKAGAQFFYDTRMLTVESEEHHHLEGNSFKRIDPEDTREHYFKLLEQQFGCRGRVFPMDRWDASHIIVDLPRLKPRKETYWTNYNLRELRKKRESGQPITVEDMMFPKRWWFTGQFLNEL